jgi:hypothetical protein
VLDETREEPRVTTAIALPIRKLILVPGLITLGITLLRLAGELLNWSPILFSREAGGAGAIVGIVWLVPVFGVYFALKLVGAGQRPSGLGAAIGFPVLSVAVMPATRLAAAGLGVPELSLTTLAFFSVASLVGAAIAYRGWPALARILIAYGLAARVPVALVMLVAILGDWGTHYDVAPPGFPAMGALSKWALIGLMPQLTFWIWFTLVVGGLFGAVAAAVAGRRRAAA